MRHTLRSAVACLVSALLMFGALTVAPVGVHAATTKPVLGWGDNKYGLVGDGTTKLRRRPVLVHGLSGVSSITHDANATYAVKQDGTVWRWGSFDQYNNGAISTFVIKTPTKMAGLSDVKSIALKQASAYVVRSDGTVWSWEFQNTPAPVPGLSDVASISLDESGYGGYALKRDGTVWEFHSDGYLLPGNVPWPGATQLAGVDGIVRLTAADYSDESNTQTSWYAVKSDGTVWTWGDNRGGQLGDGTTTSRTRPAQVPGVTGVSKVTAGLGAAYAVTTSGSVWAWGVNRGQLGDGTKTDRATPVRLPVLSHVVEIIPTADSYPSEATWYARTTGGLVYYWGGGWPKPNGDLAAKHYRSGKVPMQVPGLSGVRKVVAYEVWGGGSPGSFGQSGMTGGYAIKSDGTLWAWGGHVGAAQGGLYKLIEAWAPTRIRGISGVTSVFPYDSGAYAIGTPVLKSFSKSPTPKISGTAKVGKKLTVKRGTWSPKPSFKYQWLRSGKKIVGATKSTYVLTGADAGKRISVRVTGSKSGYNTKSKTSAKTKPVKP
ncbi:MAG TPA: hypothetical protein VFG89_06685 [Coriobacteriia bacterium]|nr:hypothetical protein [Coriobacteriia bacterium]